MHSGHQSDAAAREAHVADGVKTWVEPHERQVRAVDAERSTSRGDVAERCVGLVACRVADCCRGRVERVSKLVLEWEIRVGPASTLQSKQVQRLAHFGAYCLALEQQASQERPSNGRRVYCNTHARFTCRSIVAGLQAQDVFVSRTQQPLEHERCRLIAQRDAERTKRSADVTYRLPSGLNNPPCKTAMSTIGTNPSTTLMSVCAATGERDGFERVTVKTYEWLEGSKSPAPRCSVGDGGKVRAAPLEFLQVLVKKPSNPVHAHANASASGTFAQNALQSKAVHSLLLFEPARLQFPFPPPLLQ
eukprot:2350933-Rhodomonas_salina.1